MKLPAFIPKAWFSLKFQICIWTTTILALTAIGQPVEVKVVSIKAIAVLVLGLMGFKAVEDFAVKLKGGTAAEVQAKLSGKPPTRVK